MPLPSATEPSPRLHRRGRIEATALTAKEFPIVACLHGFTAGAELKLLLNQVSKALLPASPRLHRRGRIEARHEACAHFGVSPSPRLHRRGRIEARGSARRRQAVAACLHGFTAVAE